ncbi:MAG: hypothetical protein IPG43_11505 [Proteobacteria bacterium]|nr:hypothetical protein [Pseudomonadota bacterium]
MNKQVGVSLDTVRAVYSGAEGDLWELLMGQQIHIGGMQSSLELAKQAGIGAGQRGVDLCCCNGAGMRLLVRMQGVAFMIGVHAIGVEMAFLRDLADAGKLAQGQFIARRP